MSETTSHCAPQSRWSARFTNPFHAIQSIATTHGKPEDLERVKAVFVASMNWVLFDYENYLDDLLQEIAGETNIVVQYLYDGHYRAAYDDDTSTASKDHTSADKGRTERVTVSLDGGLTYQEAPEGVRITYEGVLIPGEDGFGELHLNATHEGLITDVWTDREASLDHNIGTSSQTIDDLVSNLVEDNT